MVQIVELLAFVGTYIGLAVGRLPIVRVDRTGVAIALVAIGAAAYTLITRRVKPEKVYESINWPLLVLFTGLFVVIAGVEAVGFTGRLFAVASALGLERPAVLTIATAIVSNLVSNVPAVLL